MTTTIDYAIRPFMREMYKQHRWGVLSMMMLHANNLNRCWPSIVGIASDLGISPNQVTKAKNWLIEHGAIQLVPYDKRIGNEELLPPRQFVYQVTGQVTIDGKTVSYLYGAFNITADSNLASPSKVTDSSNIEPAQAAEITAGSNLAPSSKVTTINIIDGSYGKISSKRSKDSCEVPKRTRKKPKLETQDAPKVETPQNPKFNAVSSLYVPPGMALNGLGGWVGKVLQMIETAKPGITEQEVRDFIAWWKNRDRFAAKYRDPIKIQAIIAEWINNRPLEPYYIKDEKGQERIVWKR